MKTTGMQAKMEKKEERSDEDTQGHPWLGRSSMAMTTGVYAKMEKKEEITDEGTQVKM